MVSRASSTFLRTVSISEWVEEWSNLLWYKLLPRGAA